MAKNKASDTAAAGEAKKADPASSHDISLGSAPTPAQAEKAVAKAEAAKAAKPKPAEPAKPVVPFRVFAALSGMKPAALAGFQNFIKREEMKPTTVAEWRKRYDAFMAKPVKSL